MSKFIPLTKGKFAIVDDSDYNFIMQWKWQYWDSVKKCGRAMRTDRSGDKKKTVFMHNQIMPEKEGMQIDHIDGNGLNNQRSNLRYATPTQNCYNRGLRSDSKTGVKGVQKGRYGFVSRINQCGKRIYLGEFATISEAKAAYDKSAIKFHGEFARL